MIIVWWLYKRDYLNNHITWSHSETSRGQQIKHVTVTVWFMAVCRWNNEDRSFRLSVIWSIDDIRYPYFSYFRERFYANNYNEYMCLAMFVRLMVLSIVGDSLFITSTRERAVRYFFGKFWRNVSPIVLEHFELFQRKALYKYLLLLHV